MTATLLAIFVAAAAFVAPTRSAFAETIFNCAHPPPLPRMPRFELEVDTGGVWIRRPIFSALRRDEECFARARMAGTVRIALTVSREGRVVAFSGSGPPKLVACAGHLPGAMVVPRLDAPVDLTAELHVRWL